MLVLCRKRGERIVIGPNIELTVVDICGNRVRLAFDAPRDVSIHRQEIYRRIQDERHYEVQYKGSKKMTKLQILALVALSFVMLASDAMAQRRGGGAVSGGMRGAVVGGMVGGESGAKTGAKIGVVTGGARGVAQRTENRDAMYAETQARTQYENTAAYQSVQHSNFSEAPPEVLVTSASVTSPPASAETTTKQNDKPTVEEAVIRKNDKPVVAITYPSDWKQKTGERYVSAVSADGHAWSGLATLEGVNDKQAGITRIKQEFEKYLQDIKFDDTAETKGGSQIVTGVGKAKKAGVDVVFAAGVFDTASGQLAGIAFVADKNLDDYYKQAARAICQTIRTGEN